MDILVLHHCHHDLGFTHAQPLTRDIFNHSIDEAIDYAERDPDFRWTCEVSAAVWDWFEARPPEAHDRFRAAVERGQLSVGLLPWHGCALMTASRVRRWFEHELPKLRRLTGAPIRTAMHIDVNGTPWSWVPPMLDAGAELLFMAINQFFGGAPHARPHTFDWIGPDDRSLRVHSSIIYHGFDVFCQTHRHDDRLVARGIQEYVDKYENRAQGGILTLTATHPTSNDNNPPNPFLSDMIRRYNALDTGHRVYLVQSDELVDRLARVPSGEIPSYRGDWPDWWDIGLGADLHATRTLKHVNRTLDYAESQLAAGDAGSPTLQRARRLTLDATDHTWHSYLSTRQPWRPQTRRVATLKSAMIEQADTLLDLHLHDFMLKTTGDPPQWRSSVDRLLILNPTASNWHGYLHVDPAWVTGETIHWHRGLGLRSIEERAGTLAVGPVELQPGLNEIAIGDLPTHAIDLDTQTVVKDSDALALGGWRLQWGPDGSLRRCLNTRLDWDLAAGAEGFAQPVVEEVEGDYAKPLDARHGIYPDRWPELDRGDDLWPAIRRLQQRPLVAVGPPEVSEQPHRSVVSHRFHGPAGVAITRRFILWSKFDFLDLEVDFHAGTDPWPRGWYLPLPVSLEDAVVTYNQAEQSIRFHDQQIPYACRDFIVTDDYVAIGNNQRTLTVATPDAPLVQAHGMNYATGLADPPTYSSGLYLWLANNYWETNFAVCQPGSTTLRYRLHATNSHCHRSALHLAAAAATAIRILPRPSESATDSLDRS